MILTIYKYRIEQRFMEKLYLDFDSSSETFLSQNETGALTFISSFEGFWTLENFAISLEFRAYKNGVPIGRSDSRGD